VGKSDVIPTISLAFTLADEYYPHQEYTVVQPGKEYERHRGWGYTSLPNKRTWLERCALH
jgi:hypothetical protein